MFRRRVLGSINISNKVDMTCGSKTYNGETQVATNITVTFKGNTLTEGVDYIVTENNGGINVGSYVVKIKGIKKYSGEEQSAFSITKVTPTVTAPTPINNLVYNASAQALINAGSTNFGTLKYSLDNSTYSTSIPSGTNATSYTIYYKVDGDSNVNNVAAQSVSNSIAKVTPTVVSPVPNVLTYNGSAQELVTAGSTNFGTLKYKVGSDSWSTSIPTRTRGGAYTVSWKVVGDSNINDIPEDTVACSINEKPVTAVVTVSPSTYTYNGSYCEPTVTVKDGETVIDPSEYTVTYSNNLNAGTATVTIYDVVGGDYYVSGSTTFTINKADSSLSFAVTNLYVGVGETKTNAVTVNEGDGTITYSSNNTTAVTVDNNGVATGVGVGDATITATISQGNNYNSSLARYSAHSRVTIISSFNVTDTSNDTKIAYIISEFNSVEIDGIIQPTVATGYTFSTVGEHTVKYYLNNTSIVGDAFNCCANMTNVTIGSGVTSIGSGAFSGCRGLTSIDIPDSVTSIGIYAFSNCSGLTSVIIGSSVTSIGTYSFSYCSNLTNIDIPDSVTSIGTGAFQYCYGLTSCTIGSGVTSVSNQAFQNCSGLTSVTIPDSVTSIGSGAFSNCSGLTSITIGSGVTSIGNYAFQYCNNLTNIDIPDSVTSIGTGAFQYCYGLTSCTIGSGVTTIGNYAFDRCSGLTSVIIGSSVTSIGTYSFRDCTSLTSVTIPSGVTTIGNYAFSNCSGLTSITIGSGVTSIGNYAFQYCNNLTNIDIPDSVTSIGDAAFFLCTSLTSCTIGSGVIIIGASVFERCSGLTSIIINAVTPPTLGSYAFYNTNNCPIYTFCDRRYSYTIANGWRDYSNRILGKDCPSIETIFNITDTSNPTRIGYNTNYISKIEIDGVEQPSVTTGYTFSTTGNHTVKYYLTVIYIYDFFYNCTSLTSVTIPDSVAAISQDAFHNCSGLTRLNSSIDGVFNIPSGVTSIGDAAFYNCTSLTSLTIPDSVTTINKYAFSHCNSLTSVTIPSGVTSISDFTFSHCTSLTSVTIPSGVTNISYAAFYECSGLTSIDIPDSVRTIGTHTFYNCTSLTSITIPDSVTSIRSNAFYGCSSLTSCTIGSGVTSINEYAFRGCSSLTSITVNATTAPTIDNSTFQNIKTGGTLRVPSGSSGYDVWMGTGNYYLGKYNWTKVEQ